MPTFDLELFLKQFLYDPDNPLLFNSGFFVFFFGVFMVLYYLFRNNIKARRYIFCFFSLYFFYKASGFFVVLVILSAIVDFFISNRIYRQKKQGIKKFLLVISVLFNLGMLCYFKYTNFFLSLCNDLLSTKFHPLNILLPIGISFYTFENLSYTIDVYRDKLIPAKKFSDYLLFLSFFPKLVMGPIVRAQDFIPQINRPHILSEKDFAMGFYLIISGMFKKLIISDYITLNYTNYIFDDPSMFTGLENLFAVYGYAAVIYCDFSGYSDVAIGIAKWVGFSIPPNFLSPYQSRNITEFWRRWHISLSSWLRDYLYIPLGGNRRASFATYFISILFFTGVVLFGAHMLHLSYFWVYISCVSIFLLLVLPSLIKKTTSGITTNLNLISTMLLGGFWHGASWNFLIWGSLHGIALAAHKVWELLTGKSMRKINNSLLYNFISTFITFHFVCLGWIFFKAADFSTGMDMLYQITHNFSFSVWAAFFNNYKPVLSIILLAYLLHSIPDHFAEKLMSKFIRIPLLAYVAAFFLFVLLYGFFKSSEQVLPIYLQF